MLVVDQIGFIPEKIEERRYLDPTTISKMKIKLRTGGESITSLHAGDSVA